MEFCSSVTPTIVTVDDVQISLTHTFTFVHIVITVITNRLPFVQAIAAFPGIVDIVITVITFIANEPSLGLIIIAGVH